MNLHGTEACRRLLPARHFVGIVNSSTLVERRRCGITIWEGGRPAQGDKRHRTPARERPSGGVG